MSGPRFGLTGLAVMGANLARNVAHHDIPIAVHNRTASKTEQFMAEHGSEGPITGTGTTQEFVQALERPRTIMTMVKAGPAVDAVIEELAPLLDEGDTIVDGGNSHFRDTQRRDKAMNERGLRFLGVGVSGGEEGALKGPSIMPGGSRESYDDVEHIFTSIAAQVDGTPCCTYVGADGAGHYVKMVHNGIEYADIQLIAEAYDLLRHGVGLEVPEIAQVFHEWNEGDLDSFLIEITATVLDKTDERTGQPLVDVILDQAEQKGTGPLDRAGRARARRAADRDHRGRVRARLSALGDQRATASQQLAGPKPGEGDARRPRARRGRAQGALRLQGRRLRAGLRADDGGREVRGLGARHGLAGDDLARRLHHPRALPRPHPRGLRHRPGARRTCCSSTTSATRSPTPRTRGGA